MAPQAHSPAAFAATLLETETWLREQLQLAPQPVEPSLASADGFWKGHSVRIETHVLAGGPIRFARFARVTGGGLDIGNVLCLAHPVHALPILGADLVSLPGRDHMVAADLTPTLAAGPERDRQLAQLQNRLAPNRTLPSGGALPEWCRQWFSPFALYTRVGDDQLADATRAYRAFPDTFVDMARAAAHHPELAAEVVAAQARYAHAHRSDDAGLRLLGKLFGEAWAERYINEVLFPVDLELEAAC